MKIKKTITLSFLSDYFPIPIRVSYCTGTVYLGSEFFFLFRNNEKQQTY